jgi:hypothetical protein
MVRGCVGRLLLDEKCMGKKEVKLPVVDLVERKSIGPSYAGV